jgi:drug/metabolite transporter (DMT)-like permease
VTPQTAVIAINAASAVGDLLVLAGAAVYSLQIVLLERFAPRYDVVAFMSFPNTAKAPRTGAFAERSS